MEHATPLILREWRGRVPPQKTDAYLDYLRATGVRDYALTPGHRGTWLLVDRAPEATEFVLLTLWDSLEHIRAFAGQDIGVARYYPEDPGYLLEMQPRVRHYDVEEMPSAGTLQLRPPIQPSP